MRSDEMAVFWIGSKKTFESTPIFCTSDIWWRGRTAIRSRGPRDPFIIWLRIRSRAQELKWQVAYLFQRIRTATKAASTNGIKINSVVMATGSSLKKKKNQNVQKKMENSIFLICRSFWLTRPSLAVSDRWTRLRIMTRSFADGFNFHWISRVFPFVNDTASLNLTEFNFNLTLTTNRLILNISLISWLIKIRLILFKSSKSVLPKMFWVQSDSVNRLAANSEPTKVTKGGATSSSQSRFDLDTISRSSIDWTIPRSSGPLMTRSVCQSHNGLKGPLIIYSPNSIKWPWWRVGSMTLCLL